MSEIEMQYRSLGRAGIKVSAISLGGWTTFGQSLSDVDLQKKIITTAFDAGINFFDIADVYGRGEAERVMGSILKEFPRHELVISSKVFWPMSDDINDRGLSRKHIMESVEKSLKRIGTDYLDVYFCHRFDENTPIEETARAMDDLVRQGKVLYWGTSEWTGAQIRDVWALCERRGLYAPQVEQPQYNLLNRTKVETDVRPAVTECGMGMTVWSPLASGLLTGKYDKGVPAGSRLSNFDWLRKAVLTDQNLERVRRFKTVSDDAGFERAQIAIAWLLAQNGVSSVITGATNVEQLQENLKSLNVDMTGELEAELHLLFPS